ncbi:MAG TPA: hypothetical protein VHO68_11580 [Bacteroidales bacterium]|nr:hypothetical protein [Bacteroidales bacterium]
MKRKIIAYGLILAGAVPVLIQLILYFAGRLGTPIQINDEKLYNFYYKYGFGLVIFGFFAGIVMIVIGMNMLKKDKMTAKELNDEGDLMQGERLVLRHSTSSSIVTVTNMRVRYYGYYTKDLRRSATNLPDSDREDYPVNEIHTVKSLRNADMVRKSFIKVKGDWGIQLQMKNGTVINIPAADADTLSNRIDIILKGFLHLQQ